MMKMLRTAENGTIFSLEKVSIISSRARHMLYAGENDTNPKRKRGQEVVSSLTLRVGVNCPVSARVQYKPHAERLRNVRISNLVAACLLLAGALVTGCGERTPAPSSSGSGQASSGRMPATSTGLPQRAAPPVIDLRTLPRLDGAGYALRTANRLDGVADGKAAAIFEHFRAALEDLGWKLSTPVAKDQGSDVSASALLEKEGNAIFVSITPDSAVSRNGTADGKQFSVDSLGTCDSSKLPRLPGAAQGYEGRVSTLYFADMKVAATAASVRNLLEANGWQVYSRPRMGWRPLPDRIREEYRKQGNLLRVLVRPAQGKEQESSVEYVVAAAGHQLPAPPDATDVQFDDELCQMRCTIPRDLQPVVKYYFDEMAAQGYEMPRDLPRGESAVIVVCKSKDNDAVAIEFDYDGLNTHVQMHGATAEELQIVVKDAATAKGTGARRP